MKSWWLGAFPIVIATVWVRAAPYSEVAGGNPVGHILSDNGYREDFAGAAYMNKFAITFRLVNNIACKRCDVMTMAEQCLAWLPNFKEDCDREEAFYNTDLEQRLDTLLPCLIKRTDETKLQCLMETPMSVPTPKNGSKFRLDPDDFTLAKKRPTFAIFALINNVACERCGTKVSQLQNARDCLPKSVNLENPVCMREEQYMLEYADNIIGVVECYHIKLGMPPSQIHCLLQADHLFPIPFHTFTTNATSITESRHSGAVGLSSSKPAQDIFVGKKDPPCNASHNEYKSSVQNLTNNVSSRASAIHVNILINTGVGT